MRLSFDSAIGRPSFELSDDHVATVVDLLCCGAAEARKFVTVGMLEVPITIQVRKAMLRLKKQLGLTNLQIGGEFELLDMNTSDPDVQGRLDIIFQFLHQFGDEDAYLGVECKRISPDEPRLKQRYVTLGVNRFVVAQYSVGHHWGILLGYVLKLPAPDLVAEIDSRLREKYGEAAALEVRTAHPQSLSMHACTLSQGTSGHEIRLLHILVDMTAAADPLA